MIDFEELSARVGEPGLVLIDVRTEVEHTGEAGYPCDPRQGSIPGSRNIELSGLIERSSEEIRSLVGEPAGAEIVCYCHSGSRSAMAAAALRAAGYNARNYEGSWHEWSRRGRVRD